MRFLALLFFSVAAYGQSMVMPEGNPVSRIASPPGNGAIEILCEGDSLTAGFGSVPYSTYLAQIWPGCHIVNIATSGDNIAGVIAELAAEVTPRAPATTGYSKVIMILCIGRNNLASAMSATTLYAQSKPYWASVRALGIKLALCSIPPQAIVDGGWNSSMETERLSFNTLEQSDLSLLDIFINLDVPSLPLQGDGIHITAPGEQNWAAYNAVRINPSKL